MPGNSNDAIIGAGGGIIGSVIDSISQIGQNKKAREHQEYMFDKQNAYNTPTMQMQRFKDAGLNPHLIYGQGNSGNSTSVPALNTQPGIKSNFHDIANSYVANKTQQAQQDQMKKALEVMESDRILKAAQTQNTLSSSAKTDQEVKQASELFDTVKAQAFANLGVTEQNYQTGILQQNKLETEIKSITANTKLTESQVGQIAQNIAESKQRIKNMSVENQLKGTQIELNKLDINLRKMGLNPNDPAWMRIITQQVQQVTDPSTWDKIKQVFKSWWGTTDNGPDTFMK